MKETDEHFDWFLPQLL